MSEGRFYVYEHLRNDSGSVFYVGKGSGHRSKTPQGRNRYWNAVVAKHGYQTRTVMRTDDEELAFLVEMELIDKHRRCGSKLTNMTDGGEGMSGYKWDQDSLSARAQKQKGSKRPTVSKALKGRAKSEDHRNSLSVSAKGRRHSEETKIKMSASRKGRESPMLGKVHTEETKRKISESMRGERGPFFGKSHSEESKAKISAAHVGRKDSENTRIKKSVARIGEKNPRFGVVVSNDQKLRQIATLKARPRVTCPHCGATMDESNAKRWHMDNCRSKK